MRNTPMVDGGNILKAHESTSRKTCSLTTAHQNQQTRVNSSCQSNSVAGLELMPAAVSTNNE